MSLMLLFPHSLANDILGRENARLQKCLGMSVAVMDR